MHKTEWLQNDPQVINQSDGYEVEILRLILVSDIRVEVMVVQLSLLPRPLDVRGHRISNCACMTMLPNMNGQRTACGTSAHYTVQTRGKIV